MSPKHEQFKLLHGVLIPQFLSALGIDPTPDAVLATKEMFKKYLKVRRTSKLSELQMSKFTAAFIMLAAREWGIELTERDAEQTMTELLNQTTRKYEQDNR